MNQNTLFFWLANGLILAGLLGGLGIGIMVGPRLSQLMQVNQTPWTAMIGLSLVCCSSMLIGLLRLKFKSVFPA